MNQSVWGPVQQEMSELLRRHPDDVPAVVDQLAKLQDILGRVPPLLQDNPLSDFNRLYLTVTESVLERLYAGRFADPAFLSRLDVEFAGPLLRRAAPCGRPPARLPAGLAVLFRRIPGRTAARCRGRRRGQRPHQLRPAVRAGHHVRPPGLRPGRRQRPAPRLSADQRDLRGGGPGPAPRLPGQVAAADRHDERRPATTGGRASTSSTPATWPGATRSSSGACGTTWALTGSGRAWTAPPRPRPAAAVADGRVPAVSRLFSQGAGRGPRWSKSAGPDPISGSISRAVVVPPSFAPATPIGAPVFRGRRCTALLFCTIRSLSPRVQVCAKPSDDFTAPAGGDRGDRAALHDHGANAVLALHHHLAVQRVLAQDSAPRSTLRCGGSGGGGGGGPGREADLLERSDFDASETHPARRKRPGRSRSGRAEHPRATRAGHDGSSHKAILGRGRNRRVRAMFGSGKEARR